MQPSLGDSARSLEIGIRVAGKYELVRRLAVGGMGQVWVARNQTTGAEVAVKLLRGGASPEADERFRHEARLGSMLSHRSVVRIFDLVAENDGTLVLIMELLRGQSLATHMAKSGPLSATEAVAIATPVLSALAHAHASGVVHRDVTPGNIFLAIDPDGQVTPKLVDFGIAKLPNAGVQTLDGRVLGTPRYMSPEQIRGRADLDGRSDLFSVAVVTYEMMTGVCPFAATTPAASLAAVLESPVDLDPRIEGRLWLELQRGLSKRPYERHFDANAMADALRDAVGESEGALAAVLRRSPPSRDEVHEKVSSEPPSAPTRSVEGQSLEAPARRRPGWTSWVVGVALSASLVVLVSAAVIKGAGHSAEREAATSTSTSTSNGTVRSEAQYSDVDEDGHRPPAVHGTVRSEDARSPPALTPTSSAKVSPVRVRPAKPVATTPGF